MSICWIPCGISGSGKSLWRSKIDADVTVCPDDIRKELTGSISDQSQNGAAFAAAHNRLATYLEDNLDVVFDATNINPKARKAVIDIALRCGAEPRIVLFDVTFNVAKERLENDRERIEKGERSDVPLAILQKQYENLQNQMLSILKSPYLYKVVN